MLRVSTHSLVVLIASLVLGCRVDPGPSTAETVTQPAAITMPFESTPTPAPSPTQRPTSTRTPIPTLTPSPTATVYPSPGPDFQSFFGEELASPNGEFIAILTKERDAPDGNANIQIFDTAGQLLWTIDGYFFLDKDISPRAKLHIHHWTSDSSRLYYFYSFGWEGWPSLIDGFGLRVIEIATGIQTPILTNSWVDFGFSPQDEELAYIYNVDQPEKIVVRDIQTGVENSARIPLDADKKAQAGWINWALDGKSLVFFTLDEDIYVQLFYMQINGMNPVKIGEYENVEWISPTWSPNGTLIIYLYMPRVQEYIEIDMDTGVISGTVTATPIE